MDLPPELLSEVIGYLSPHDTKSFQNCSLVAKSWIHPCQRRLFEIVDVRLAQDLESWRKNISPFSAELLQHVRSLFCRISDSPNSPSDRDDFLRDYLPSFQKLRYLTLSSGFLLSLPWIRSPLVFQENLSSLCLFACHVKLSVLVALINCFPNLSHLDLHHITQEKEEQPIPPLSSRIQKLSVREFYTTCGLDFVDRLLGLCPQLDEVVIGLSYPSQSTLPHRVIDRVGTSVKCINLQCYLEGMRILPREPSNEVRNFCCRLEHLAHTLELYGAP